MSRLLMTVSLVASLLASCASYDAVSVDGLGREKERFLELAFSPIRFGPVTTFKRERLYIRDEYTISVRGNDHHSFEAEIHEILKF